MNQQEQLELNLKKLDKMSRLPYNWNGRQGLGFPLVLIKKCEDFIKGLPYQPNIAPTGRATVYIEYKQPNGDTLAFEYGLNKIVCCYVPAKRKQFRRSQDSKQYDVTDIPAEELYKGVRKFCNYE